MYDPEDQVVEGVYDEVMEAELTDRQRFHLAHMLLMNGQDGSAIEAILAERKAHVGLLFGYLKATMGMTERQWLYELLTRDLGGEPLVQEGDDPSPITVRGGSPVTHVAPVE
jgi:hypothetical protein